MKFFLETTKWKGNWANHVYLLNDSKSKLYAYVKQGTNEVIEFNKPMQFHTRGRQFKEVANSYNYQIPESTPVGQTYKVVGSRGDEYTMTKENEVWTCTCSGFKFRNQCRHIKQFT